MLTMSVTSQAKVKLGVRGGYNITNMNFDKHVLETSNRAGFYLGPTLKIDLALGFDIEASALYNKASVKTDLYDLYDDDKPVELNRESFAVPVNLRWGLGDESKLSAFIFAGPQFDFAFNEGTGDKEAIERAVDNWHWNTSAVSLNVGVGLMLLKHIEMRVNYNIPCGETGHFKWKESDTYDDAYNTYKAKAGIWQIGATLYF